MQNIDNQWVVQGCQHLGAYALSLGDHRFDSDTNRNQNTRYDIIVHRAGHSGSCVIRPVFGWIRWSNGVFQTWRSSNQLPTIPSIHPAVWHCYVGIDLACLFCNRLVHYFQTGLLHTACVCVCIPVAPLAPEARLLGEANRIGGVLGEKF